mgnify:CR=1 FL=1
MSNKTVYPFGTDGQLPSSVGIINDLITGGADKALSAEMGKELGDKFKVEDNYTRYAYPSMFGNYTIDFLPLIHDGQLHDTLVLCI